MVFNTFWIKAFIKFHYENKKEGVVYEAKQNHHYSGWYAEYDAVLQWQNKQGILSNGYSVIFCKKERTD